MTVKVEVVAPPLEGVVMGAGAMKVEVVVVVVIPCVVVAVGRSTGGRMHDVLVDEAPEGANADGSPFPEDHEDQQHRHDVEGLQVQQQKKKTEQQRQLP